MNDRTLIVACVMLPVLVVLCGCGNATKSKASPAASTFDHSLLKNIGNIDPKLVNRPADPNNDLLYSIVLWDDCHRL